MSKSEAEPKNACLNRLGVTNKHKCQCFQHGLSSAINLRKRRSYDFSNPLSFGSVQRPSSTDR